MKITDMIAHSARTVKEFTRANAPTILDISGVVGLIVAGVLACKQTTKLDGILEEHREKSDKIKDIAESGLYADEYTAEDAKNDLRIVTAHTAKDICKLYAIPVGLAAVSVFAILKGDKLHRANEAALGASAVAVKEAYTEYRKSVAEEIGEEKEKDIYNGVKAEKISTKNPETGKEEAKEVRYHKRTAHSAWGFYLDDRSTFLEEQCIVLRIEQIKNVIARLWDKFITEGHLYVNDIRRAFGVPEVQGGWKWGWIYDRSDPRCSCDLGLDFLDNALDPEVRDFVNGWEDFVFINIMPDGIIDTDPRVYRRAKHA